MTLRPKLFAERSSSHELLIWLAALGLFWLPVERIPAQSAHGAAQQRQLLDLVNAERAKAGLSRLQWDDHLADAARAHTQMMVDHGQLSHQFRGEPALPQRAGAAGAHFNSVAENVAYAGDIASLHQNLMQSPHHRANILSPESNAIGIGLAEKEGELYVTEDFARLLPSYATDQFSQQVAAAFNRLRQSKGLPGVPARPNPRLQQAACTANLDAQGLIKTLPGATNLAIFTASQPGDLSPAMRRAAADKTLRRMQIGVCFKDGNRTGFSSYWVVAAFYPAP